ncbi:MAG TPA: hypothetical protein VIK01_05735 [Polyangiaceae bacterium]
MIARGTDSREGRVCLPKFCVDGKLDSGEADVDRGGGQCVSNECDAVRHVCGGVACHDKVEDGDESDVDCGGTECGGCLLGQKCNSPFDCGAGTCQFNVISHV